MNVTGFSQDNGSFTENKEQSLVDKQVLKFEDKIEFFLERNIDSCRAYATRFLNFSSDKDLITKFKAFKSMGQVNAEIGTYKLAVQYYKKAENLIHGNDEFLTDLALLYNDVALVFISQGDNSKALEWLLNSKGIVEGKSADPEDFAAILNLGYVYEQLDKKELAEKYYLEYKALHEGEYGNQADLGNACNRLGALFLGMDSLQKAKAYFLQAKEIFGSIDAARNHGHVLNNLAIINYLDGNKEEALVGFEDALKARLDYGKPQFISESYLNLGEFYAEESQLDKAIEFYKKSYDYAYQGKALFLMKEANEARVDLLLKNGDKDLAIEYLRDCASRSEEISNNKARLEVDEIEQFNFLEKKSDEETKAIELSHVNDPVVNWWILSISLLVFILGLILFLYSRKKRD